MSNQIDTIIDEIETYIFSSNHIDRKHIYSLLSILNENDIKQTNLVKYGQKDKIQPLEYAILTGDISLIKKFITPNSVKLHSDNNRVYPLLTAIWDDDLSPEKRYEIVKLLLENGADPNDKNIMNETPLKKATSFIKLQDIVLLLLQNGAKDEYVNYSTSFTNLEKYMEYPDEETKKVLHDNIKDFEKETILQKYLRKYRVELKNDVFNEVVKHIKDF
jgi:ankyrin repeat protein